MTDTKAQFTADDLLRHGGWLRRLATRLVGETGADDLVQETWLAALCHQPRRGTGLGPWLRCVLDNRAISNARSSARQRIREHVRAKPDTASSTVDLAARAEATRHLAGAVSRLTPAQRDAILLRYFDDLSPAVIAKRLGMPAGTVRSHLSRGLAHLRNNLDTQAKGDRSRWVLALAPFTNAITAHTSVLLMSTTKKLLTGAAILLLGLGIMTVDSPFMTAIIPPAAPDLTAALAVDLADSASATDKDSGNSVATEEHPTRTEFVQSPKPSTTESLLVQVVHGETGEAVSGATVRFFSGDSDWSHLSMEDKIEIDWNRERVLLRVGSHAETDVDGYVLVPLKRGANLISARKGKLFGTGALALNADTIRVSLLPEKLLHVEVRHADGRLAPGVEVKFQRASADADSQDPMKALAAAISLASFRISDRLLGVTDAQGKAAYHLEGKKGSSKMTVYAAMTGYKHGETLVNLKTQGDEPVCITLPRCGSFTVRLLDAEGRSHP